jgi:hypothetical protein
LEIGRIGFESNAGSLGAAADYESRRLSQKFRSSPEQIKVGDGLANQEFGLAAGSLDT